MRSLSKPLSPLETSYLYILFSNATHSTTKTCSMHSIETRLSRLGAVQLAVLRYLITLNQYLNTQKVTQPNPKLFALTEAKILAIMGCSNELGTFKESLPTIKILIGEMLVSAGLISEKQLSEAIAEQNATNRKLGEILVKRKWLTFDQLDEFLSVQVEIRIDVHDSTSEKRVRSHSQRNRIRFES